MVDCNNCPEPGKTISIIHTRGSSFAALLRLALPDAIVHDDCSIEIDLPTIDGFRQDENNPQLFHLEEPPCSYRAIEITYPHITVKCIAGFSDCDNCDKRYF